ncbi:hypothetical protein KUCAC02_027453 [Chaenocephalus aceratus]|uniref:Uncharacterized protein n=1 Tax=Chaenocephalus aceratus TaxID=36190 RepID=A0ACB9W594_CHAAC|nr:hypothetical protein KUCAC02_027453 [Chaenocephalus aceratus]
MTMSLSDKQPTENESLKRSREKQKKEDAWKPDGPFFYGLCLSISLDSLPESKQQEIQKALHLFSLGPTLPKTLQQAKKHTYHFWETQPVPRLGDSVETHGPIVEGEASVRMEPYSLPQGFSWDTLDLSNPSVLKELCTLLNENYMEEDDNTMRFEFSSDYLQWALQPPNWLAQWHCGVRVDSNKKLVGFIAALPADVRIYEMEKRMSSADESTSRGVFQAVYTAALVLPTPLSSCRYWHRPLNLRKLMELSYPGLKQNMSLQRAVKFNRLPDVTKTPGLRRMTEEDAAGFHSLLQANLGKFHLSPMLSLREVEHWLLPGENVIDTYVVQGDDGTLTDMVSFYNPVGLMEDTLVLAQTKGFDIFFALNVMDNQSFLENLKFSISDKSLHYYLYNWMCPTMSPDKVGLVLPN